MKSTLTLVAALGALPLTGWAHAFESADKWAVWTAGDYTVANDVWGDNPGPETIWADSAGNWGVTTTQSGGGIKSYPHSDYGKVHMAVSALGRLTSSFSADTPAGCAYDMAYDIWLDGNKYEVMIWNRWERTNPIAKSYNSDGTPNPTYTNVTIAGVTYDVYTGIGGSGACMSFLRRNQVDSGTVDLAAVLKWISTTKWYDDPTLTSVQCGWEITNTGGAKKSFTMNSFSVTR